MSSNPHNMMVGLYAKTVSTQYLQLTKTEFSQLTPDLVQLYIEAMNYPREIFLPQVRTWRQATRNTGFSAVIAIDEPHITGFAYGFCGDPHQWWTQQILRGFYEQGGMTAAERELITDFYELAEIHVLPTLHNRGTGSALLNEIAGQAKTFSSHIMLSTPEVPQEANSAFGLYRKFGFTDVLRNFYFRGDSRPFAVLARGLPFD